MFIFFVVLHASVVCAQSDTPAEKTQIQTAAPQEGLPAPQTSLSEAKPSDAKQDMPSLATKKVGKSQAVRKALVSLLNAVAKNQESLDELQKALDTAEDDDTKKTIQQRIDSLQASIADQREDLSEIASGISMETFAKPQLKKFDWKAELAELFAPLVQQIKDLTEHPREIEHLRTEINRRTEVLSKAEQALKRIDGLIAETKDPDLVDYLKKQKEHWESLISDYKEALELAILQLDQKQSETKSLTDSISSLFQQFFSSRGLNFIFACLAFCGVFFLVRLLHQQITPLLFKNKIGGTSFSARLVSIAVGVFGSLLAILAALAVFYVAGDWVLLGLSIILIFGAIWSAKAGINKYWEQVKLLLNIGGVREGERLVWNGIPYRVDRIRYYTVLNNPALSGGMVRVHIDDLTSKCSRPFEKGEPFFPTKKNDYVQVGSDYGKILRQTPDFVQLELLSGAIKYYPTSSFLSASPLNVATGFTVTVVFGVDYKHQDIATTVIPETLRADIADAFSQTAIAQHVKSVSTSFKEAADSSLNISLFVTLTHEAATWYYSAGRLVQKVAVETCTRNGWEIPYPQITVHKVVDDQ
ncbi:mechanosensitive ion channel family protein [Desulfovibrio inopinatus]|uniref:mechanosensitive ion channel family protein n=1 Tax=Desulfovibrio inopinatus TaxID=102109 RepID=UPI0012EBF8F9|nr:mechanosensitive ion channel family protein [Desulfovibrio inopinatus]